MLMPPFHSRLTKFHPRHFLVEVIKTRNITSFFIFIAFQKLLVNRSINFNSIIIRLLWFLWTVNRISSSSSLIAMMPILTLRVRICFFTFKIWRVGPRTRMSSFPSWLLTVWQNNTVIWPSRPNRIQNTVSWVCGSFSARALWIVVSICVCIWDWSWCVHIDIIGGIIPRPNCMLELFRLPPSWEKPKPKPCWLEPCCGKPKPKLDWLCWEKPKPSPISIRLGLRLVLATSGI